MNHFGDSEGADCPMSFLAQTRNWYSLPGMMLQAVNLLLKMPSATVCQDCLTESLLDTMQCRRSSRFSSGEATQVIVTVPGTFSSSSTGPGGLGSSMETCRYNICFHMYLKCTVNFRITCTGCDIVIHIFRFLAVISVSIWMYCLGDFEALQHQQNTN